MGKPEPRRAEKASLLTRNVRAALRKERLAQTKKAARFWSKESLDLGRAEEAEQRAKALTEAIAKGKMNEEGKEAIQRLIDDLSAGEAFWTNAMAARRRGDNPSYDAAFKKWKVFHPGKAGIKEFDQWLDRFVRKKSEREAYLPGILTKGRDYSTRRPGNQKLRPKRHREP